MFEENTENSSNSTITPPGVAIDHQESGNQKFYDNNRNNGGVRFGGGNNNYPNHRPSHPSYGRGGGGGQQRQWHDNRGPRPRGPPPPSFFTIRPANPSAWNNYQRKPAYNNNNNTNLSRPYYDITSHQHPSFSTGAGVSVPPDGGYRPWSDKDEFDNLLEVCLNPKRPPKLGVDYRAEMLSWVEKGCRNKPRVFDLFDSQGVLWLLKFTNSHSRLAAKEVLDSSIQFQTYDYRDFSPTSQAFVLKNRSEMRVKRPQTNPSTALRMIDMALSRTSPKTNNQQQQRQRQRQNKELTETTTTTTIVDDLTENLNTIKLTEEENENVDKNTIVTEEGEEKEGGGDEHEHGNDNADNPLLPTEHETNELIENPSAVVEVDATNGETTVEISKEMELKNPNEDEQVENKLENNLETKPTASEEEGGEGDKQTTTTTAAVEQEDHSNP